MADDYSANIATMGVVPVGGQVIGRIDSGSDRDWFKVSLQAGATYLFEMRGSAGGGGTLGSAGYSWPTLTLYDAEGRDLKYAREGGAGNGPLMAFVAPQSGTYFLGVQDDYSSATGTYTLRASVSTAVDDYGNSVSAASVLPIGSNLAGSIEIPQDRDWFQVTLEAGVRYGFDLRGAAGGGGTLGSAYGSPELRLHDAKGSILKYGYGSSGNQPSLSFVPFESGVFFLSVGDSSDTHTGTYTVSASTLPSVDDYPNSIYTYGYVYVGGQVTGNTEIAGDIDWFRVYVEAGRAYSFELRGADGGGGTLGNGPAEALLKLYDGAGALLQSTTDGGRGGDPLISFVPTVSGNVYLGVEDFYRLGTGTYTLSASVAPPPDDFGSSTSTAGVIAVGGTVSGVIEADGDRDWFKVSLQAGVTYLFALSGSDSGGGTLGSGSARPRLILYNQGGYYLRDTTEGGIGGEPLIAFIPTTSGEYFLGAGADYYYGTGSYTLRASVSPFVDDYANSTATTGVLAIGGVATGSIEVPGDVDWIRVDLEAGTTYYFEMRDARGGGGTLGAGTSAQAGLILYDSSGYYATNAANTGLNNQPWMPFTPAKSGAYYLAVGYESSSFSGTYTLLATAPDKTAPFVVSFSPEDSAASAGASTNVVLTFSEGVQRGTGTVVLRLADGTVLETFDAASSPRLSITGALLTVDPSADLLPGAHYFLDLPTGMVTDQAGNAYRGLLNVYDFNGPIPAGLTLATAGTAGDDVLIPTVSSRYMGGPGDDVYILRSGSLALEATATIVDTEGSNVVQIADGTVIAASLFLNDALQLVLSTGAKLQLLGASAFSFQVGADRSTGDTSLSLDFSQFGALLGVAIPAAGQAPVSGTANYTVPGNESSAFTVVALSRGGTVVAKAEAEAFVFEFKMMNGRATQVDGNVLITGFDVARDKLVFQDAGRGTVLTEAQFMQLPGVAISEDPFGATTTILFDPGQGASGGVTLAGVVDQTLSQIVVETLA